MFDAFLEQCSPNLLNRVNNYLMTEFVDSKKIKRKGIFESKTFPVYDDLKPRDALMKEVFELSKMLIIIDRHLRQVIFNEGEYCDGKTYRDRNEEIQASNEK